MAREQGGACVFLDEANALSLEHLLPPAQAREASARLVAALCEKLDALEAFSRMIVVGSTSRTDSVDSSLVAPGRLDRLVEVPLPDGGGPAGDPRRWPARAPRRPPGARSSPTSTTARCCRRWAA